MIVDGQTYYFDDALHLAHTEDESVDVAVTSPPYNVGKLYEAEDGRVYCDSLSPGDYRLFLHRVFKSVHRTLKLDGVFWVNIGDPAGSTDLSDRIRFILEDAGFTVRQRIIWIKSFMGKGHFTPSGGTRRFDDIYETIWFCTKSSRNDYRLDTKRIGVPYTDKNNVGRYGDTDLRDPGNAWFMPYEKTTGKKDKKGHAAPFPVELPYRCIKAIPDAKVVLDPFAGLGTTLRAARALGVSGVGYDLYAPSQEVIMKTILEPVQFDPYVPLPTLIKAFKDMWLSWMPSYGKMTVEVYEVAKLLGLTKKEDKV